MQESRDWSWVDKDGIEHPAVEDELTFALSSEELPPYILVCKRGWTTWLPAMQVAELAWALPPGSQDTPRKPEVKEDGQRLPPPLELYPELEARAADILSGVIDPTLGSSTLPPVAPVSAPPPRATLDAVAEDQHEDLTVQLPTSAFAYLVEEAEGRTPPNAYFPPGAEQRHALRRASAPEIELTDEAVMLGPEDVHAVLPSTSTDGTPLQTVQETGVQPPPEKGAPSWPHLLGVAGAVLAVGGLWLALRGDTKKTQSAKPKASSAAQPSNAPAGRIAMQCAVSAGPSRIGEWAQPKPKPILRPFRSKAGLRVAVGYAKTSRYALGASLDPENLAVEELFSNYESSPLASVSPLWRGQKLSFMPARAASTLQSQLVLNAAPPFAFGLSKAGFAIRKQDSTVDEVLWPTNWGNISVPSARDLESGGFAIAFRTGGERGEVQVATVSQDGKANASPTTILSPANRVGPPSLTGAEEQLLVVFAAGPRKRRDMVMLATSKLPALPTQARPILRSEKGSVSPSIGVLPNKDLLLQWTTGSPGHQRVVAQPFTPDLSPVGPELLVSPTTKDAHSGVVTLVGSQLLSIYLVRNGANHELWGTTLSCL